MNKYGIDSVRGGSYLDFRIIDRTKKYYKVNYGL